jgi:hypothetical protein
MNKEQPHEPVTFSVDLTFNINYQLSREFIYKNIIPIINEIKVIEKNRGPYRTDVDGKSIEELDELFMNEKKRLEELRIKRIELIERCAELYPGDSILVWF